MLRNNAMFPKQKSGFRAGLRPDSNKENNKSGPPAGPLPAGTRILTLSPSKSNRHPTRIPDLRPGKVIAQQRVYPGPGLPGNTRDTGIPRTQAEPRPEAETQVCRSLGYNTLCYAYTIMFPNRKSGFRAGFRPDFNRENLKIGPKAGRRADFEAFLIRIRPTSDAEPNFHPGSNIA